MYICIYIHICIYLYIIHIHISEYVITIFFDISLQYFANYQDAYLNENSLYIKFLYKFFLPDVASSSIAGFMLVTLVLSVTCIFC